MKLDLLLVCLLIINWKVYQSS